MARRTNKPIVTADVDLADANGEAQLAAAAAVAESDQGSDVRVIAAPAPGLAPSLVTADSGGVLVLFPYTPAERKPGVVYPVMKGNFDMQHGRVPVSAFGAVTEEGRSYLSLSIGERGSESIHGALFRAEEQDPSNGRWHLVPGKANDRFGLITRSAKTGDDEYTTLFSLRFFGRRRMSAAGKPFIRCKVYAERSPEAERPEGDNALLEACF